MTQQRDYTLFDVQAFYSQHGIPTAPAGDKHSRAGWVQSGCPFCKSSEKYHLGFCLSTGKYNCYRCGSKGVVAVVREYLKSDWAAAFRQIDEHMRGMTPLDIKKKDEPKLNRPFETEWPMGTVPLLPSHQKYLLSRNIDPNIWFLYSLRSCGPIGPYKHRIIIPIYIQNRLVSYQGRDVTGKAELPYKACEDRNEAIHHKDIVYGFDLVPKKGDAPVVLVEGVVDAWRLGPGSLSTFGVGYTKKQIDFLCQHFNRFVIMFDGDEAGMNRGDLLHNELLFHGKESKKMFIPGDPGSLSAVRAWQLMKSIREGRT